MATPLVALALGWHLVASIGGGDMPVVVSMLNSYSGWAAAASGFLLGNDLLIVTGALVGSSGAYLSYIMCKAMNRSFISVIAGGFGNEGSVSDDSDYGEHTEISAEDTADLLREASSVVITPGYGMAVAQAKGAVAESGWTFSFDKPDKPVTLRGVVRFRWRKGDALPRTAEVATEGGHRSSAGSDPVGYSAATCGLGG